MIDSPFVGELPTDNQALSVHDQLEAGIRFLQAQASKISTGNELLKITLSSRLTRLGLAVLRCAIRAAG